jgi:arylsulfatase A-like enzyme
MPEDMKIPVFFRGPAFEAGKVLDGVSIKDIAPTITALLGVEPDEEREGKSVL